MFSIGDFKGPLDLLWQLVSRDELDILDLPLKRLPEQFRQSLGKNTTEDAIQKGADFISLAATLIWFKSLKLLPKPQQELGEESIINDDPATILHYLIDYYQLKQAAQKLTTIEEQQSGLYPRGVESTEPFVEATTSGIGNLSLEDLARLFQQILSKAKPSLRLPKEEEWKVSDKIHALLLLLEKQPCQEFHAVFHAGLCREELIVTFLALLELIKTGKLVVYSADQQIFIKRHEQRNQSDRKRSPR